MGGDVLLELQQLPDDSVNCCVTSPPYWGLRDYSRCSCATSYKRDKSFEHLMPKKGTGTNLNQEANSSCPICHGTGFIEGNEQQIGMEQTPAEYVHKLTEVFHEVKRILRPDGTLWLNVGDCYSGSQKGIGGATHGKAVITDNEITKTDWSLTQLAPKNLVGLPWRLAFALQEDGWVLRCDVIWAKPNAMPESVTDRPTKAHEYIFLFSKSQTYYYDSESVKEKAVYQDDRIRDREHTKLNNTPGRRRSAGLKTNHYDSRNLRSVWTFNTQPYPDAHFAVFPEELPTRCIKAGCPVGGIVLDPFAGSGTTGAVARALGRSSIMIELNPEYVKLIEERTESKVPALTAFGVS